jgi:pSer/pThr/pTyr-binding forkhead associated (FHA) protein
MSALNVLVGPDKGRSFTLEPGATNQVGRGSTTLTKLTDPSVSRLHFEIVLDGKQATLTNVSSTGTTVNGESVSTCQLRHGDLIKIGNTTLRYVLSELEEAETILQPMKPQ